MEKAGLTISKNRIRTIDVLRALTMFLMIFVNDLWSLTGIPEWLGHAAVEEDRMGFSDVIFPLFLFIVGLSIPLAINVRLVKKDPRVKILGHILTRTIALLVMGLYMVNYGVINQQAMGLDKNIWQILMVAAIFLLWLDYTKLPKLSDAVVLGLRSLGFLLLVYLALIYRGGTADDVIWMRPHWWGILGLIGWAYLLNSLIFLLLGKSVRYLLLAFFVLLFLNIQENGFFEFFPSFKLVVSASNHVLVASGVLCTVLYLKFKEGGKKIAQFLGFIYLFGILAIAFGYLIRPFFPISKILATPSWTAINIGIGFLSYTLIYIIVDLYGYYKWANSIKAAGTSTLTCYVLPFLIYPSFVLLGVQWSDFLSCGLLGLVRSILFSLAVIIFVRMLEMGNIRLRI